MQAALSKQPTPGQVLGLAPSEHKRVASALTDPTYHLLTRDESGCNGGNVKMRDNSCFCRLVLGRSSSSTCITAVRGAQINRRQLQVRVHLDVHIDLLELVTVVCVQP